MKVFRHFKYIYMEFNGFYQSGMIMIYDLHPQSVQVSDPWPCSTIF